MPGFIPQLEQLVSGFGFKRGFMGWFHGLDFMPIALMRLVSCFITKSCHIIRGVTIDFGVGEHALGSTSVCGRGGRVRRHVTRADERDGTL